MMLARQELPGRLEAVHLVRIRELHPCKDGIERFPCADSLLPFAFRLFSLVLLAQRLVSPRVASKRFAKSKQATRAR